MELIFVRFVLLTLAEVANIGSEMSKYYLLTAVMKPSPINTRHPLLATACWHHPQSPSSLGTNDPVPSGGTYG